MYEFLFNLIGKKLTDLGISNVELYKGQYERLGTGEVTVMENSAYIDFGKIIFESYGGSATQAATLNFNIYLVLNSVDDIRMGSLMLNGNLATLKQADIVYNTLTGFSKVADDNSFMLSNMQRVSMELLPTDFASTFVKIEFLAAVIDNQRNLNYDATEVTDITATINSPIVS